MLMYERVAIGGGGTDGVTHAGADALILEAEKRGILGDAALRDDLMHLYIQESVKSMNSLRTREPSVDTKVPFRELRVGTPAKLISPGPRTPGTARWC